ncbi:hypothetical protein [Pseudomonas sp.]|uniref:hypothetical protein n=1 Tax=Pseudomonas sp. TaxID=306 RepID=UPI0026096552|nr:hypothetical protein [Pseudomonas sp.]
MSLRAKPEPDLRYGSVCSCIKAVSIAWHALRLQAAWFAEIDSFPCAVLAHYYPQTSNHGNPRDYTRITWRGRLPQDCPDGPRYKAIGNSMAVPCLRWIGERLITVLGTG